MMPQIFQFVLHVREYLICMTRRQNATYISNFDLYLFEEFLLRLGQVNEQTFTPISFDYR